eukprot:SAG11_NODE_63_length_18904_cov_11.842914_5_plen_141_part_00
MKWPVWVFYPLFTVVLLSVARVARAPIAASNHEVLLQHAWHKFEDRGDWSDWEDTWRAVDHDSDGRISVGHGELAALFRVHYNILHEKLGHDARPLLIQANEQTYRVGWTPTCYCASVCRNHFCDPDLPTARGGCLFELS